MLKLTCNSCKSQLSLSLSSGDLQHLKEDSVVCYNTPTKQFANNSSFTTTQTNTLTFNETSLLDKLNDSFINQIKADKQTSSSTVCGIFACCCCSEFAVAISASTTVLVSVSVLVEFGSSLLLLLLLVR